jgi:tartrate dehydratase beta subunit/fumarate hydratase class I family protein
MSGERIINPTAIKIGDSLRSKPVGRKDWFVGEVVEIRGHAVVLRDAERRRWLREWSEVEVVP